MFEFLPAPLRILIALVVIIFYSCLSIYLPRKYRFLRIISSKESTLLLMIFLAIITFLIEFNFIKILTTGSEEFGKALGSGFGIVFATFIFGFIGTFTMKLLFKKIPLTKEDYWSSRFFWLIIFFILLLNKNF